MSALSSLSSGESALPAINPALEPASIRNGNAKAKNAYETGLGFEDILVGQLTQEMMATVPGLDGSSDDNGLGGTDSNGLGGSDASSGGDSSLSTYSSLMTGALTSSIMSSGGTGVAMQIAESLDPALEGKS